MSAYLDTRTDKERPTVRYKLVGVLGDLTRQLATLTPAVARKLYADRSAGWVREGGAWIKTDPRALNGATLHGELRYARQWADWCVREGWMRANPFTGIEPVGTVNRGKPKLRVNPSRQFLAYLTTDCSLEATAVLTAFMLGLRATEVVKRTVEDLDDDGWLLWIRDTKTPAGDREIELPGILRTRLTGLAAGKHPTDRLFGGLTRYGLHYHTIRLCEAAGVPRVTPHGLRGSGATKAVRLGGSIEDVARALGHADEGATLKRHYLGGGAVESARARAVDRLLPDVYPETELTHTEACPRLGTREVFAFPVLETEVDN